MLTSGECPELFQRILEFRVCGPAPKPLLCCEIPPRPYVIGFHWNSRWSLEFRGFWNPMDFDPSYGYPSDAALDPRGQVTGLPGTEDLIPRL